MWRPDSTKPFRSDGVPPETVPPEPVLSAAGASGSRNSESGDSESWQRESDFAELAAKFAAHGGGRVTAEVSGERALDVVLNEIVEQACLATGATGAGIALAREGEMVCRASSGENAPELGMRLDMNAGLSGACVRTRQIQCCGDALADPSADAEASRQLGVRSVVVLPLLQDEELIGIFEIFSPYPAAFGDRDLQTVDVLARRILKNVRAQSMLASGTLVSTAAVPASLAADAALPEAAIHPTRDSAPRALEEPGEPEETEVETGPGWRLDGFTTVLGVMVLTAAVLMGVVSGVRLGWLKASARRPAARVVTTPSSTARGGPAGRETNASSSVGTTRSSSSSSPGPSGGKSVPGKAAAGADSSRVPEGSLRVYENGKEIFRMEPAGGEATTGGALEKAAGTALPLQPARIVELSPDAVEGSLVRRVEPQYPEQLRMQHIQGSVLLDVRIGRDGSVQELKLVSGNQQLADEAIAAVRQWQFKPHVVDGSAVEMETRITLNFTLPAN